LFPHTEKINQGIEINLNITEVKINSGLKEEDFK